ncbi:MAG: hypothetical protein WD992_01420 [Candidatus Levyibacteriota bacterium]
MKKFAIVSIFIFILFFIKSQQVVRAQTNRALPLPAAIKEKADLGASVAAERKLARTDRLEAAKIRACEARQNAIVKRSNQIVRRAGNQLDVFAKISQRVQEFYQTTLIPQGKVVANYDSLVTDIASSGAAIMPLLAMAETSAASFSCDKDRPADQVKTFNEDMRVVITGLETYRKSVRALIVAVRGVAVSEPITNSGTSSALPL